MIKRAPLDLPPAGARAFVKDITRVLRRGKPVKRDGIAVRQLRVLKAPGTARETLPLSNEEIFAEIKDGASSPASHLML